MKCEFVGFVVVNEGYMIMSAGKGFKMKYQYWTGISADRMKL